MLGLAWGILTLPRSEAADELQDIESRLLHFETFSRTSLTQALRSDVSKSLSACDTHSQRALLLMEMPLAEVALRSGASREFDQRHPVHRDQSQTDPELCAAQFIRLALDVQPGSPARQAGRDTRSTCSRCPTKPLLMRHGYQSVALWLRCRSCSLRPNRFGRKFFSNFCSLSAMDLRGRRALLSSRVRTHSLLLQTKVQQLDLPGQKAFSDALQKFRP